jgi:hypothetical protein
MESPRAVVNLQLGDKRKLNVDCGW